MEKHDFVIVGAGFTGLTAAMELVRAGKKVLVLDSDREPGGLAGTFQFRDGVTIEKFYHHWFTNDVHVPEVVKQLGLENDVLFLPSRTGMYYNGQMWRMSTPLDLLRFKPLSFFNRIRLGLLVLRVRRIKDWKSIEHLSIREWLEPLCGKQVYKVVWEPLIDSKFSVFADAINAVWFWKKLVLRGSTRNKKGGEQLAYFKGGFGRLAQAMADDVVKHGGEIRYDAPVSGIVANGTRINAVRVGDQHIEGNEFLFTPSFAILETIFRGSAPDTWVDSLARVNYLGNMCLVLEMTRSLSDTYWLNVNDPGFPFVGVIEHTNFDPPANYQGKHIVYLSRYLATQDPVWNYSDEQYLEFALGHLRRMFPEMERSWINDFKVWRSEYAQPVTERNYSQYLPPQQTPFENASIRTMAQIYPEDRGTNYAIREGKLYARKVLSSE